MFNYRSHKKRFTTAVVLVTKQVALSTASEIDKMPKHNFRSRAKVVLGYNCSAPGIGIRDYAYHPDYAKDTFSTLAMIQLETDQTNGMGCLNSQVRIYKMKYVSPAACKNYYRRTGLDIDTIWPSHTACARSTRGGRCVWRSGAILVMKVGSRWRLLGFGVYGPGCQAPARFLDYGMYHTWVRRSIERIGSPTVSTIADNHIIMRRSMSNVQRYGPCDVEETSEELFTDFLAVDSFAGTLDYNMTIYANVEYSCILMKADHSAKFKEGTPKISLRRWCTTPRLQCSDFQYIDVHFDVEITFSRELRFSIQAYVLTMSCGIDKSPVQHVYEGLARVETYPWLGFLYYPYTYKKRFTTAVVLVTKQIALASAAEIDAMPKENFRSKARVVLGYNCSAPGIGIRDYSYHPDFAKDTISTLAMIQLETDHARLACARSVKGGHCVWRSGAILVVKMGMRWRLLGFGVYGPGCQAPARFLDYGMYHTWVRRSIERIGSPTVTTIADNHIVLRRSMSNVQRFGPCDTDETKRVMYSDYTYVKPQDGRLVYNVSIYSNVEYACVIIKAQKMSHVKENTPRIHLRRWCSSRELRCSNFQYIDIHFYAEVLFDRQLGFSVIAYGREARTISPQRVSKYLNYDFHLQIPEYNETREFYKANQAKYPWFRKGP
ncbi:unnamed protein product [Chrysodeixis includens]|uniref:Peptidase S1 domain-containing protein n=1 Tax=Chrysodeixis includens TaxID=689277 RepID=A0A9N8KWI1_CHRIL|nr:unnamed protein product [Chrysodeixis includens]